MHYDCTSTPIVTVKQGMIWIKTPHCLNVLVEINVCQVMSFSPCSVVVRNRSFVVS